VDHRADIVDAGDLAAGHDRYHVGGGANRGEIDPEDARMGFFALAECRVQRAARLDDVVDVCRFAGDVQVRAVVRQRCADRCAAGLSVGSIVHDAMKSTARVAIPGCVVSM